MTQLANNKKNFGKLINYQNIRAKHFVVKNNNDNNFDFYDKQIKR
jgi:hypothetical protein